MWNPAAIVEAHRRERSAAAMAQIEARLSRVEDVYAMEGGDEPYGLCN